MKKMSTVYFIFGLKALRFFRRVHLFKRCKKHKLVLPGKTAKKLGVAQLCKITIIIFSGKRFFIRQIEDLAMAKL